MHRRRLVERAVLAVLSTKSNVEQLSSCFYITDKAVVVFHDDSVTVEVDGDVMEFDYVEPIDVIRDFVRYAIAD